MIKDNGGEKVIKYYFTDYGKHAKDVGKYHFINGHISSRITEPGMDMV